MMTVNTTSPTCHDATVQSRPRETDDNDDDDDKISTFFHQDRILQNEPKLLKQEKEWQLLNELQNHLCRDVMNLLEDSQFLEDDNATTESCPTSSTTILTDSITLLKDILSKVYKESGNTTTDDDDTWNQNYQTTTTNKKKNNNVQSQNSIPTCIIHDNSNDDPKKEFCQLVIHVANQWFCQPNVKIMSRKTRTQKRGKRTWQSLQLKAECLLLQPIPNNSNRMANVLIICFLFTYFSLLSHDYQKVSGVDVDDAKAAASAIATILKSKNYSGSREADDSKDFWKTEEIELATLIFSILLKYTSSFTPSSTQDELNNHNNNIQNNRLEMNLNILTYFARAFGITSQSKIHQHLQNQKVEECTNNNKSFIKHSDESDTMTQYSANAIQNILSHAMNCNNFGDVDLMQPIGGGKDYYSQLQKQRVSGALALASQVSPWPIVSPVQLVKVSVPFKYYIVAENICLLSSDSPQEEVVVQSVTAVELLIDTVMECKLYRIADKLSTNLYDIGGKSRFVEARYHHACGTIGKVILNGQYNLIDRLVDRVDRAIARVETDSTSGMEKSGDHLHDHKNRSQDIRNFTIHKLQQAGQIETLYRLIDLWNMDRELLEEHALKAAIQARREKYIQYEDIPFVITNANHKDNNNNNNNNNNIKPPELISDPNQLLELESTFFSPSHIPDCDINLKNTVQPPDHSSKAKNNLFGMDAEWDEETDGVALLQISNMEKVILLDMKALERTKEGQKALECTVGVLLDSMHVDTKVIGFSCSQDISRLRKSIPKLSGFRAVVDLQTMVPLELKKYGLSRISKYYLGKPLDKAEQCSFWSSRPLTEPQRAYAALDAWVCIAIYQKIANAKMSTDRTI